METKICFLLCSLFPEDYEIYVEDLARLAWGLELYKGIKSIEEVRSEVLAAIDILKNSCLLLNYGERHVKMHDIVRDVALWMASNKKCMTWSQNESFELSTAISLKQSQIDDLSKALKCPNLKILLLLGDDHIEVVEVCFPEDRLIASKASQFQTNLKILHLESCRLVDISILGKLTTLRTLHLESSKLHDISILGKLKVLEVLSFSCSNIKELPEEIGDLNNLKLLDLSCCQSLERIPPDLIRRLSKLEELYLKNCESLKWAREIMTGKETYATMSELKALPKLTALSLKIAPWYIPKDYVFPKLRSYDICIEEDMNNSSFYRKKETQNFPIRRSLKVNASMIHACKQLFGDVESLNLKSLAGCPNLVPDLALELNQWGFCKLTSLVLESCYDMICLAKTEQQALSNAFSNLVNLTLIDLHGLEELYIGDLHQGFLQKLKTLRISNCKRMIGGIPILQNLETLHVQCCEKIQVLFRTTDLGSTQQASSHHNLRCLKTVEIYRCNNLMYLFPATVSNSLGQLETLQIDTCTGLKEIIQEMGISNISLHSLSEVYVDRCHNLTSLSSLSHGHVLENLEKIHTL